MQRGQLWWCDVFPSFIGISGGFGVVEPRIHLCPFRARIWPFQAPKTLRFKGTMANFRKYYKTGEKKRQKDKWYPLHACTGGEALYYEGGLLQHRDEHLADPLSNP